MTRTRALRIGWVSSVVALGMAAGALAQDKLPRIVVDKDDTIVKSSCTIAIADGKVIADPNQNGVLIVGADGVTITFEDRAVLRGAAADVKPDMYQGIGIRIDGHKNVTIRGARLSGFKGGIHATNAPGLTLDHCVTDDVFRQHLRSTPAAEDGADWLHPHDDDANEWLANYGAAFYVEDSTDVTVHDCRVRQSQNGLLLDRVERAKIYDNDFSFLSGWGLGLWRSNDAVVSRNAIDFCVRGYSHGVYNRGQDSAGILIFEQCSRNTFVENSVTHGGDCIFGFAGREALGEATPKDKGFDCTRKGCNDNVFIDNDLSYGVAHGIEMTFSFGNQIWRNRFVGNGICGIWGGYSQETVISANVFEENGEMGYGLERGGVNVEHGWKNLIVANTFARNRCGVHLWGRENADFAKRGWGKANYKGGLGNVVQKNTFDHDTLALHLRDLADTTVSGNTFTEPKAERKLEGKANVVETEAKTDISLPKVEPLGVSKPVGARPALRGRQNIIMGEWGPWDHETPFVQPVETSGRQHAYALHRAKDPKVSVTGAGVTVSVEPGDPAKAIVKSAGPGVFPYTLTIDGRQIRGTIVATTWTVTFFRCTAKPNEDPASFDRDRKAKGSVTTSVERLDFRFGGRGPGDLGLGESVAAAGLGRDHFGLVAETKLRIPAGKWRVTTQSDDGIRVTAGGERIIDNWTWHVPTKNQGFIRCKEPREVPITVEYFELDGSATLTVEIEPAP